VNKACEGQRAQNNLHKNLFETISKNDVAIDDHNFGKKISKFFIKVEPKIQVIFDKQLEVKK